MKAVVRYCGIANDINTFDNMQHDVAAAWSNRRNMPVALAQSTGKAKGYGIGAVNFELAQEMSASLVGSHC